MISAMPDRMHRSGPRGTWWDRELWFHWVLANMAGEFVGLGLAALLGIVLALAVDAVFGTIQPLVIAIGMVGLGTFEGVVVGAAQWIVLRHHLSQVRSRTWVLATAIGAFVAWSLGMIPSTVMDFAGDNGASTGPDIGPVVFFGLAAAMGAALGVVLAIPQWIVLRRHVAHAVVWIPANALA
jgi:hypothetical protein